MESAALLQLALQSLNVHQRLWRYLKLHDLKLPVEFVEFKNQYNGAALILWMDKGVVVYIKHYLIEKFEKSNGREVRTIKREHSGMFMERPHGRKRKPIVTAIKGCFEIALVVGASSEMFLRNLPKDQLARLELVLRNYDPKDQVQTFTETCIASHEYPLELLPFVNNVLEKAVVKFLW